MQTRAIDDRGHPMILDFDVGGVEVPTRSGNPVHAPTGRFGTRFRPKVAQKRVQARSTQIPPDEEHRRLDAIRDAAREFHDMDEGDAREFLQGRARDVALVDIPQFLADVHAQRLTDLVDVLDHSIRRQVASMKRKRRTLRVVPPRGWLRKTLAGLNAQDAGLVAQRLRAKGWSEAHLRSHFLDRFQNEDLRNEVAQIAGLK